MKSIRHRWNDLSISKKLNLVVGVMAVLIAGELVTLRFAMRTLSAVRAFVSGEGRWSKAQKNAVYRFERFTITRREAEYSAFLEALKIPDGDHAARIELLSDHPDLAKVRQGFLAGHIHPDDILPMIELLRRFYWISYIASAIEAWTQADLFLDEIRTHAANYRAILYREGPQSPKLLVVSNRISRLNDQLTEVEETFSDVLGEGSRWLEYLVITLLFMAVLTVESIGLTLTYLTSRKLSRGLQAVNAAATRIGHGDFSQTLEVSSKDEIGQLNQSVNRMKELLQKSYGDLQSSHIELETRVAERTAELARLATENARLYEQAKCAVQMRDEFLSIASHELRTPLTSLHLQLQMLSRSVKPSPADVDLRKIENLSNTSLSLSRRLNALLEELMDLTRIRVGKLELKRERCDLSAIVCDVTAQLSEQSAQAGSSIAIHARQPIFGEFDPTRMGQVVTNLVSNAIKYGSGQPIDITTIAEDGRAYVIVQDHGLGIAPEKQAQIFERFERGSPHESISGLGLGLYISRQIIEAHGGKISVESFPGKGSTFKAEIGLA